MDEEGDKAAEEEKDGDSPVEKQDQTQDQTLDYESRILLQGCQAQQHLLTTYSTLLKISQTQEDESMEVDQDENTDKQVR